MPSAGIVCSRPYAFGVRPPFDTPDTMNISRDERRVLNALSLGGKIAILRDDDGRAIDVECYSRKGWLLSNCTFDLFKRLRAKKVIASKGGEAYRITRTGLGLLRA
jgi:uncharacterized protein YjhX (UPF0386 family)